MAIPESPKANLFRIVRSAHYTPHESLSPESRSRIWQERYMSANGMVGGVAHFGELFRRPRLNKIIEGLGQKVSKKTGFSRLYRIPEGDSIEDIDRDTYEVARKLVQDALDRKGWKIEDVDVLDFTSSVGNLGMARRVATEVGIREEDIRSGKVKVTGKYIACDGSGKAMYERLLDEESQGKKVLLLSIDPVTSLIPLNLDKVDPASIQLFSNGAAVLAYQPGVDMKLLPGMGITEARRDEKGIRAVPRYFSKIKDLEGGPLFVFNTDGVIEEVTSYPYPENGNGEMDPLKTYDFFAKNMAEILERFYKMYKKQYPDSEPDFVIGHHPSAQVLEGLRRHMTNILFSGNKANWVPTFLDKLKWSVTDGNSSGSTSLIAFNRMMADYKPGEHGFYISFGAGGSFTVFGIEMLPGGKKVSGDKLPAAT
jgi:hypothetical protein